MKTIITSVKGPPLRRVLCSFLFGAAAFCVVATNIQAAIQAPPDIVWVTSGKTIGKYNANGTAINTNFLTEQPVPLWPLRGLYGIPHLGGILASASQGGPVPVPTLYVACEWVPNQSYPSVLTSTCHCSSSWYITYAITLYDAVTGSVISGTNRHTFQPPPLSNDRPFGPAGMAGSYVANYSRGSITEGGNLFFINSTVTKAPYALAVGGPNGNILYVTNNAQSPKGNFYISTYSTNGGLLNPDFIENKTGTGGLYGLALSKDNRILYVSVFSGSNPGVYTYKADTGQPINHTGQPIQGLFVRVNEPSGIAIGSPRFPGGNPTLYVASQQDAMIYEFDATTGAQLSYSIKVNAPANISVYPATQQ